MNEYKNVSQNFMRTRNILIYLNFISTFCYGQETLKDFIKKDEGTQLVRKLDTLNILKVETVSITKPRKLLFIKLNHQKLIVKDLIKTDNKIILKGKSKFVNSMDAAKTVRFARIKIRDNRIFQYKKCPIRKRGIIIEYDLAGKQLKKNRVDKQRVILEYIRE